MPTTQTPTIEITFRPASGNGDLDAHIATCECGYHQGTSLGEDAARRLQSDHLAWHARRA